MIRLDEVRARIEAKVPALIGRLGPAVEFARLIERNQLPQVTPAGYVLLAGLSGGQAQSATGMFIQDFAERVSIVLVDRVAGDALGAGAMDETAPLVRDVIAAVLGWGPDDAPGVFVLEQAETVGVKDGALVFQIDITLQDQVRIIP